MGYELNFYEEEDRRRFDQLIEQLHQASDTAFIFLGAGFSYAANRFFQSHAITEEEKEYWHKKLPLWKELVRDMSDEIPGATAEQKRAFLESHDPIDVAQFLKITNPSQYRRILRDSLFIEENKLPGKLPDGHEALIRLQLKKVVTANFDQVFEFMYTRLLGRRPQIVFTADQLIERSQSSPDTTLIKMHGCISNMDTIVLAREDYAKAWKEKREIFNDIKSELQTATCLFLGYSLSDTNFNFIYDEVRYVFRQRPGKLNFTVVSAKDRVINSIVRQYWSQREMQLIAFNLGTRWTDYY